jgi:hypothetical protein
MEESPIPEELSFAAYQADESNKSDAKMDDHNFWVGSKDGSSKHKGKASNPAPPQWRSREFLRDIMTDEELADAFEEDDESTEYSEHSDDTEDAAAAGAADDDDDDKKPAAKPSFKPAPQAHDEDDKKPAAKPSLKPARKTYSPDECADILLTLPPSQDAEDVVEPLPQVAPTQPTIASTPTENALVPVSEDTPTTQQGQVPTEDTADENNAVAPYESDGNTQNAVVPPDLVTHTPGSVARDNNETEGTKENVAAFGRNTDPGFIRSNWSKPYSPPNNPTSPPRDSIDLPPTDGTPNTNQATLSPQSVNRSAIEPASNPDDNGALQQASNGDNNIEAENGTNNQNDPGNKDEETIASGYDNTPRTPDRCKRGRARHDNAPTPDPTIRHLPRRSGRKRKAVKKDM